MAQARAEKLFTYTDSLVSHSPRSNRGSKRKGLSKLALARARLAWVGDGCLLAEDCWSWGGHADAQRICPEVFDRMLTEAREQLKRWPFRAALAPHGSRFEQ